MKLGLYGRSVAEEALPARDRSLALWPLYGVFRKDPVIILANVASLAIVLMILYFKRRDMWKGPRDVRT